MSTLSNNPSNANNTNNTNNQIQSFNIQSLTNTANLSNTVNISNINHQQIPIIRRRSRKSLYSKKSYLFRQTSLCEKRINFMFRITLIPFLHNENKFLRYIFMIILNILFASSLFCNLFYVEYYINQAEIWTFDLVLSFLIYNILNFYYDKSNLFLFDINSGIQIPNHLIEEEPYYEEISIINWKNYVTLLFYGLYMGYWLYFAIYMLYVHAKPNVLIQLGNILMFFSWYLFFSTMSVLYYYICVKLIKRYEEIINLLKFLKENKGVLSIKDFTDRYYIEYKKTRIFCKKWNIMLYLGFILLTFHIPVDLFSIVIGKKMYDVPGFIIKLASLLWYIYCICCLNNLDTKIIKYLYKHQIFQNEEIELVTKYIETRPVSIDLYGFKLNGWFFVQLVLLLINFILPIIYGLFANNILN